MMDRVVQCTVSLLERVRIPYKGYAGRLRGESVRRERSVRSRRGCASRFIAHEPFFF